jgi:hypothetical protein
MATATIKRKPAEYLRTATRRKVFVDMPQGDIPFFRLFADKMGWVVNDNESLWEHYIKTSPQNVPLTEEDIMEAVREVRYGKA